MPLRLIISTFFITTLYAQDNTLLGKVFCGYQGWFYCAGDGSPNSGWFHWGGNPPAPGRVTFELYPDVTDYKDASLFQTGLGDLGNGHKAKLFSSYLTDVIDRHFLWMQENGIDGVALQRFIGDHAANRDSITIRMARAAEKYKRLFYVMWDLGANVSRFQTDCQRVENLNVFSSPNYAHQNGKPVVCLWGFGLTSRGNDPTNSLTIINWLKDRGYYVIGGTPTNWRTGTGDSHSGYTDVYNAFNMISPWSVGRYKDNNSTDNYCNTITIPDKAYCDERNIDYQPVIFSGFAWSNWINGARNDFPRRRGEFLWRQVNNVVKAGIENIYVAMFDEYDESTAIMKAADSYLCIPNNQYFLTTSADGTYISSDFYLRLAGAASRVLKGTLPLTTTVPIPYSIGPVFFRSSFEPGYDAVLTWSSTADTVNGGVKNVTGIQCAVASGTARTGSNAVKFSGTVSSTSQAVAYCKAITAGGFTVDAAMSLSYAFFPQTNLGRFIGIDLVTTDGTTLHSTEAVDTAGIRMNLSVARGTVNQWSTITCNIGRWLAGKTLDRILVAFDHTGETGQFNGFIDNLIIQSTKSTAVPVLIQMVEQATTTPLSINYSKGTLQIYGSIANELLNTTVTIYSSSGRLLEHRQISNGSAPLTLKNGVYIVRIEKRPSTAIKLVVGK